MHVHVGIQLVSCIEPAFHVLVFFFFQRQTAIYLAYLLMPIIASFLLVSLAVKEDNDAFQGGCTGAVTRSLYVSINIMISHFSFLTNLTLQCIGYIGTWQI